MMSIRIAAGIGILAMMAGLWLRGERYAERARTNEVLLNSARAIGEANAALAQEQARANRRIDAAAGVNALRKQELRKKSDSRRKEIFDVPQESDGPLAPVLRDQLDRLPRRSSSDSNRDFAAAGDSAVSLVSD